MRAREWSVRVKSERRHIGTKGGRVHGVERKVRESEGRERRIIVVDWRETNEYGGKIMQENVDRGRMRRRNVKG